MSRPVARAYPPGPARPWGGHGAAHCRAHLPVQAANPLLGRQEIEHEYDELQAGDHMSQQQDYQKNKDAEKREAM